MDTTKTYIYLDHNIYITAINSNIEKHLELEIFLEKISKNHKNFICLYSPAHMEEIYKAYINSNYKEKKSNIMSLITRTTKNMEVRPHLIKIGNIKSSNLVITHEDPYKCYKRVENIDTREYISNVGKKEYLDNKNFLKKEKQKNRSLLNLSNKSFKDIWEDPFIKSHIDNINNLLPQIKKEHISYIGLKLSDNLKIEKQMYPSIKNYHYDLEFTIEVLFKILNRCGYYAEKGDEKKGISAIHDISHAIYASLTDYLITTDERFAKKCKAVYYYLGINTKVIHTKNDVDSIISNINNILN